MGTQPRPLLAPQALIARYALLPHPEGGWYREMHRSTGVVVRGDGAARSGLTAILFLLEGGDCSRWHRVEGADESWHFVAGSILELFTLPAGGGSCQRRLLGSPQADCPAEPLLVVPAGVWQAARSLGAWSLVSCCVGPGFDFADFSLLRDLPSAAHPCGTLSHLL